MNLNEEKTSEESLIPTAPHRPIRFAFFGTPELAVMALSELKVHGLVPELIITQPDKPVGRKLVLTPPPVKLWAEKETIPVLQPEKMNDPELLQILLDKKFDVFVVFAYGKIIPESILKLAKQGALNIHPSLLPKWRGPSPLEATLLHNDKEAGVSIILMDKEMDHGPIVAAQHVTFEPWPPTKDVLSQRLIQEGVKLLAHALPRIMNGTATFKEQDHNKATYTQKIVKNDGLIDLNDEPFNNYLKFLAYKDWPAIFFIIRENKKETRVKITEATFENDTFVIKKVIPEGKKEIDYASFAKIFRKTENTQ